MNGMVTWNDMELPRLCLGTANLGMDYGVANRAGKPAENTARDLVAAAAEFSSAPLFDTALAYGDAQAVLGRALSSLGIAGRARVITKLPADSSDRSDDALLDSLELSRRTVGVPTFFGVLLHEEKHLAQWESRWAPFFQRARNAGLTRFFGASIYTDEAFFRALNAPGLRLLQLPASVLDQRAWRGDWPESLEKKGVLGFARSVLLQGLLTMEPSRAPFPAAGPILSRFRNLCARTGMGPAALCVAGAARMLPGMIMVLGAENAGQWRENVAAAKRDAGISAAEWRRFARGIDPRVLFPYRWDELRAESSGSPAETRKGQ